MPVWKQWLGPPVFEDEEKTRLAAVLYIILIVRYGVSPNDLPVLQKPFTLDELFNRVRQALDTPVEITA